MSDEQLTIEGGAEPYEDVAKRAAAIAPLSDLQRDLLRCIRLNGPMRAVEAGVMVHAARNALRGGHRCGTGARGRGPTKNACCKYAASDGLEAMKRLRQRGLVRQRDDRAWELA